MKNEKCKDLENNVQNRLQDLSVPEEAVSRLGTALVVSGPSGAGKTTICRELQKALPRLHFSVSCTTRLAREGEVDGVDYHFMSRDTFQERVAANDFLEYAEVHGNFYGTLKSEVECYVADGQDVLLDIDVQGARQVREHIKRSSLAECTSFVFFAPPSYAELERRLRTRATENEEVVQRRLENAKSELSAWSEYDYLVINDYVDEALQRIFVILDASHLRTNRFADNLFEFTK